MARRLAPTRLKMTYRQMTKPGINSLKDLNASKDLWYSLDGRKLGGVPTAKGIYINNGKKVLVRDKR